MGEQDGVVITHYGEVDDTVEVGSNLYQIDTEAVASVVSSSSEPTTKDNDESMESIEQSESETAAPTITQKKRVPLIKFLGKLGWMERKTPVETVVYIEDDPMYGRPLISDDEMDALVLGGASLAPGLIQTSKAP